MGEWVNSAVTHRTLLGTLLVLSFLLIVSLPVATGRNSLATLDLKSGKILAGPEALHPPTDAAPSINWSYTLSACIGASPAIGDVDGDGDLEIVVVSWDRNVYCLSTSEGLMWQQHLSVPDSLNLVPVIIDIDGDGNKEVIVAYLDSCVFCLDSGGRLLWSYTADAIVSPQPVGHEAYPPIIVDIDGDSRLEILIGSTNNNIYCLDDSGALTWRYRTGGIISASPVVTDVNNDGELEVLLSSWDGCLYTLSATGELVSTIYAETSSNFVVLDIDGDGGLELISERDLLDISSVSLTTGGQEWRYQTGGGVTSPIVADVDNDTKSEVIFGSLDKTAYCLNEDGSLKWSYFAGDWLICAPIVVDLDNNSEKGLIFELWGNTVLVLQGANGVLRDNLTLPESGFPNSPVVADVNNDGIDELILTLAAGGSGPSWIYSVQFHSVSGPPIDGPNDSMLTVELLLSGLLVTCAILFVVGSMRIKRRTAISGAHAHSESQNRDTAGARANTVSEKGQGASPYSPIICRACGASLDVDGASYCPHCGSPTKSVLEAF